MAPEKSCLVVFATTSSGWCETTWEKGSRSGGREIIVWLCEINQIYWPGSVCVCSLDLHHHNNPFLYWLNGHCTASSCYLWALDGAEMNWIIETPFPGDDRGWATTRWSARWCWSWRDYNKNKNTIGHCILSAIEEEVENFFEVALLGIHKLFSPQLLSTWWFIGRDRDSWAGCRLLLSAQGYLCVLGCDLFMFRVFPVFIYFSN